MAKKTNLEKLAEAEAKLKKLSKSREHYVDSIMVPLETRMEKTEELIEKIKADIEKENLKIS